MRRIKLNKAFILSSVGYRGKGVFRLGLGQTPRLGSGQALLAGLVIILALSPLSTTSENHENLAEAATIEQRGAVREEKTLSVWVTAYSSTPEETDDTPFITASGKTVRDGIVATNFLPMGTKVLIPKYFGDKIFTVEDRMHARKKDFVDIWMPTKEQAQNFGIARTDIFVLE